MSGRDANQPAKATLGGGATQHPATKAAERDANQLAPGTRVRLLDHGNLPSIREYAGRVGVTERPEADGCYVRFADQSYVFVFWGEAEAVDA